MKISSKILKIIAINTLKGILIVAPTLSFYLPGFQPVARAGFLEEIQKYLPLLQLLEKPENPKDLEAKKLLHSGILKALKLWQQALTIYQETKNYRNIVLVMNLISTIYSNLRDFPKAIDYLQQSLTIARSNQNIQGEINILESFVEVYLKSSDFPKAIGYSEQLLTIARQKKDRESESRALGLLGNAYSFQGNYSKAIEFQEQALAIVQKVGGHEAQITKTAILNDLASTYRDLGNYPKAIYNLEQSLKIAQKLEDPRWNAYALTGIASVYIYLEDFPKAIDYLQQVLKIARETKNRELELTVLANLGLPYNGTRDYTKAIDYLNQALKMVRQFKDSSGEATILINLGYAYRNQGNNIKAIEYLQQSLTIIRKIKSRAGESVALANLGSTYTNLKDYPKAIKYLQQAATVARETKERRNEGLALSGLGYVYYKQGNVALAEKTLNEAMKISESLRDNRLNDTNKIAIFDSQRDIYRTLQQVLVAQNKTDTALEISERGRARAFADLLASRLTLTSKEELSINPPNIEEIKQIAKTQNSTLVQYSIIHDENKVKDKPKINESYLSIWVIKPSGEIAFRKVDLKAFTQAHKGSKFFTSIADLVPQVRKSINVRANSTRGGLAINQGEYIRFKGDDPKEEPFQVISVNTKKGTIRVKHPTFAADVIITRSIKDVENKSQTSLQLLHKLLIQPVINLLPTDPSARVIFIPHQELFLVPFNALQDQKGKYLIEKHTIITAPSIQVLQLNHQQRQNIRSATQSPLIVGNPTPNKVGPLPFAEQEAKTIAKLLGTQAITGNQATKQEILKKLSQARIIHMATHGIFDERRGLRSALALAPSGNKDDGLVTAEEISKLKLKAHLAVLSACDTGRGDISGDGVVGLSRSLITAGVPSVIVSLWKVPDESTSPLMVEFYKNLQRYPNKAVALRQAMLTTMERYPDPVDWAAFTLIGEAR
jgi:CHAT domain-containing protein/Tfp pilus assembly protein PilF